MNRRPIPLEVALQRYWPTPKIIEEVVALLPAPPVCAHRPPNARVLRHVQTPDLDLPRMGSRMRLPGGAVVVREVSLELSLQRPEVSLRQHPLFHRRLLGVAPQHR